MPKNPCVSEVFWRNQVRCFGKHYHYFLRSRLFFTRFWIRKTGTFHGLKTDASFRFERGTDPNLPIYALKRAALLIQEVAGGQIASEIVDIYPNPIANQQVAVKYKNIDRPDWKGVGS